MLRRLLGLGIIILVVCLNPASLQAKDLKVNLTDPDRPGMVGTGNTVSTVLSIPTVAYGENQVLGTVRITGKPGIRVPLQEGQKIMAELDPGVCYMCTPTPENYRDYIDWPAIIDGQTNQITDPGPHYENLLLYRCIPG